MKTPSGVFEVGEACAGLRFIIANLVVATLFAYWAYNRLVKWLGLLVISLLVPIIANGLRVFGIVYIAYLSSNRYATGVDHIVYGWVFFVFTMLIILLIGSRFADRQIGSFQDEGLPGWPVTPTAVRWRLGFPLVVTAVLAAAPIYAQTVMRLPDPPTRLVAPSIAVKTAWPRDETTSDWQPRVVNPDLVIRETYSRGGEAVDFYVAYFAFERESAEAVSQRHRLDDGRTWTRTESGWQSLRVDGLPSSVYREQLASSTLQSARLVLWWYWIGGEFTSSFWRAKALEMRNRLLGRSTPTAIVALSSRFDDRPDNALRSIQAFLRSGFAPTRYLAPLAAAQ